MHHIIIGTAGHVDHGKTTLVKALTGQETDRLKEEKDRGISIELGFAFYQLPNGQKVGLVDVPGHERFIKQMLAGVAGIDLVLLIVAADEGVMPQTEEHLDIITLLNVKKGIVVLTKIDLVEEDWLELVKEDVQEILAKTGLADAPIIPVSAKTGQGISDLEEVIAKEVAAIPPKVSEGRPRIPIDRVFTITGFGTVVTGTLWSGKISLGDKLLVYPQFLEAKVRNLQVHGEAVAEAKAGQRVAINLGNISLDQIARGNVLAAEEMLTPTYRVDVEIALLANVEHKLTHRQRVRVYLGTTEVLGRVVLLDREELQPGEQALAQLVLEKEVVALREDRFVIRSYSPMVTIGGGIVIDSIASKVKRYREDILQKMKVKLAGSPEERLLGLIKDKPFILEQKAVQLLDYEAALVKLTAQELELKGKIQILAPGNLMATNEQINEVFEKAQHLLAHYHLQFPLRWGMPKEELRTRLGREVNQKLFAALLENWLTKELFIKIEDKIALPSHQLTPTTRQEQQLAKVLQLLSQEPYQPPVKKELANQLKETDGEFEEVMQYLANQGEILKIAEELYFLPEALEQFKEEVTKLYQAKGEILLGEVRDMTNSSRKYILPLLEYLDQIKFTKRIGDKRVLY